MIAIIREAYGFSQECRADKVSAYAAQSAYFTLLSLIPFLLFFGAMLKYTPVTLDFLEKGIRLVMPDYVASFLVNMISETYASSAGLLSISGIVAIWSASKGIQFLTNGLNTMYELEETRSWLKVRLWSLLYTFLMIFSIVLMLVLLVFGGTLQDWLARYVPPVAEMTDVLLHMKGLIGIGALTLIFALFYWALPDRRGNGGERITYSGQLPGALLAAIGWYAFSWGVSIYVDYFDGFSSYGSLATIVLIMFWLYSCMYILMICAEINNLYAERISAFLHRKGGT